MIDSQAPGTTVGDSLGNDHSVKGTVGVGVLAGHPAGSLGEDFFF